MAHVATGSVVRQLESLFEGGSVAGLSDRQLLERFIAGGASRPARPPSPRWWPGTGRWCWASAASSSATASTPRTPSRPSSSSWPGRPGRSATPTCWATGSTASRSARRVRKAADRPPAPARGGRRDEGPGPSTRPAEPTAPPADRPAIDREQAEALHGEIDRLPRAFRLPVVLCYFEGLTLDEAARRLRCPAGTLRSRLARAREKLRRGLTRRGVVLPARRAGRGPGAPIGLGVRLIPSCAIPPPGPRSPSRPVTPPAGRSPPPPRPWPRRSCDPC